MDEQRLQALEAWTQREYALHDNLGCEHACVSCEALVETRAVIAEVRRLRQCPPEATGYWPDHIRAIADQRDAALAERDGLRELLNVYNIGGWTDALAPMQRALKAEAALTEARRVLRSCEWAGRDRNGHECCPVCGMVDTMGHRSDCALAAVLAQEEPS